MQSNEYRKKGAAVSAIKTYHFLKMRDEVITVLVLLEPSKRHLRPGNVLRIR